MRDYALSRAHAAEAAGPLSFLSRLIANWRAHRAMRRLDALDDGLLRDIGLTRADVHWAQGLPLSVNATLALEDRTRARRR